MDQFSGQILSIFLSFDLSFLSIFPFFDLPISNFTFWKYFTDKSYLVNAVSWWQCDISGHLGHGANRKKVWHLFDPLIITSVNNCIYLIFDKFSFTMRIPVQSFPVGLGSNTSLKQALVVLIMSNSFLDFRCNMYICNESNNLFGVGLVWRPRDIQVIRKR